MQREDSHLLKSKHQIHQPRKSTPGISKSHRGGTVLLESDAKSLTTRQMTNQAAPLLVSMTLGGQRAHRWLVQTRIPEAMVGAGLEHHIPDNKSSIGLALPATLLHEIRAKRSRRQKASGCLILPTLNFRACYRVRSCNDLHVGKAEYGRDTRRMATRFEELVCGGVQLSRGCRHMNGQSRIW